MGCLIIVEAVLVIYVIETYHAMLYFIIHVKETRINLSTFIFFLFFFLLVVVKRHTARRTVIPE